MYLRITNIVLLVTLFTACKNSTEPAVDKTKNPKEYTWTIDTLEYPGEFQTGLRSIWATRQVMFTLWDLAPVSKDKCGILMVNSEKAFTYLLV